MPEAASFTLRCKARAGSLMLDVDLQLMKPWTVLFGPSGSGKSTVLRLIAGLWMPDDTSVGLRDRDLSRVPAHLRGIGLVAQQAALFPHLDAGANVGFGASGSSNLPREMMQLLEIEPLQHVPIAQLTGGERQRVALARALAAAPRLLLLDEVFTGMHRAQRTALLQRVREHCARHGIPVLSVTHDVGEALSSADEVLRMDGGSIVARGAPRDVLAADRLVLLDELQ